MKSKMVGSWEIEELDDPDKWFAFSSAYLDGSIELCKDMISGKFDNSFPNAQVVLGLCHHSMELFYKGVLHKLENKIPRTHNLFELEKQIAILAPHIVTKISSPFRFEQLPPSPDEDENKKKFGIYQDQQFRYHLSNSGTPWEGIHAFNAETFLHELIKCSSQYKEIIPSIIKGETR
jgi:hypothetical protein